MNIINILNHEKNYVSMFSKITEHVYGYEAEDVNQKDKYDHNFLLLQNAEFSQDHLNQYIQKKAASGFAVFRYKQDIKISDIEQNAIIEKDAYYGNDIELIEITSSTIKDIDIKIVDPLKDKAFFDFFYEDSKAYGVLYAKGNLKREKQVLNLHKDRYMYLQLIYQDEIIGMLNTFIDGDIAKVDDFVIRNDMQKKGFGSALMKKMINMLKNRGVKFIYLVTNQDDTPKNMYQSWGLKFLSEYFVVRKTL